MLIKLIMQKRNNKILTFNNFVRRGLSLSTNTRGTKIFFKKLSADCVTQSAVINLHARLCFTRVTRALRKISIKGKKWQML